MSRSLSRDQVGDERWCGERDGVRWQKHLYIVLDDWQSGYSFREVSLSSRSGEEGADEQSLPLPQPFLRVTAIPVPRRGSLWYTTSAFGTKIMVIPIGMDKVPVVDVLERSVIYSPGPDELCCPIFFPVSDDKLFVMDMDSFEICRWSTKQPTDLSWSCLPDPPFDSLYVSSYAVQPDKAVLVSTREEGATPETFILDLKDCAWKHHGNWALPFTGCGHYDPFLDAFVGLSERPETFGYLYSCSVPSTNNVSCPTMSCTKEKVYSKNPTEKHVSATLVSMGRGEFCLVECVSIDVDDARAGQEQRRYMYRLMTFSLSYDVDGGLKLENCRVCYYNLPHETTTQLILRQEPVAFWL